MAVICVFGDSTEYGAWDISEGGWVNRLRKYTDSKGADHMVYNMGVSGDTSADILKRFEPELKARCKEAKQYNEEVVVIIACGSNDAYLFDGKRAVTNKEFSDNVIKLMDLARKYTKNLFFLQVLPVSELKTTPIPWNPKIFYENKELNAVNDIIFKLCSYEQVPLIRIRNEFEKKDYHKLLYDGLHPNSEGHELIYLTVRNTLIKQKLIT